MANGSVTIKEVYELVEKSETKISQKIDRLSEEIDDRYVTKVEFHPVQKVVYALIGAILLAVLMAIMALIIKQ